MKKTFNFGKIDYNNSGRKNCSVEVEIELRTTKNGELEFAACGDIWNPKHTSVYSAGQNLDKIAEYIKDSVFLEIYDLWKKWHLNTMRCGGPKQEQAVKQWEAQGNAYDYKKVKEYLKSIGLLYEQDIEYGTKWWYEPIDEKSLTAIYDLLKC